MTAAGIVRPARRPPGWLAPGPPVSGPTGAHDLGPWPGEDLCYLAGDWRIFQRLDGHRWSLDDLVTAWVAAEATAHALPARIADLGCGIGSVLLLLAWRFPAARCVGIEAQELSVDLARRSIAWNGIGERCRVVHGDLREGAALAREAPVDLVTGTPPYLAVGTATASARTQRAPSRLEHRGGIEAYCAATARVLAPGGRFVACAAAGQHDRVRAAATHAGLAIAKHLEVVPREGKAPLFAVHVMARTTAGKNPVPASRLLVRDTAGVRTAAFRLLRASMGMPP